MADADLARITNWGAVPHPSDPVATTGTADIDISASDYTAYQNLVEIAPQSDRPLRDARIVFDLAKATTGFAAQHTTQTITLAVARKVDGTNWRIGAGPGEVSSAITGTLAAAASIGLDLGNIGPDEGVRVYVKLSAENSVDVELPFVLYYRGDAAPTVTPVAAA